MEYRSFWKRAKRMLALLLALALFLNGWSNYDLSARATESSEHTETDAEEETVSEEEKETDAEEETAEPEETKKADETEEPEKKEITGITVELGKSSEEYTGQNIFPDVSVKDSEDVDVTGEAVIVWKNEENLEVQVPVNAGVYTCIASYSADGKDFTNQECTFQIVEKSLASSGIAVELAPEGAEFDNQTHPVSVTVKDGDRTLIQDTDYTMEPSSPEYAEEGKHTIKITGIGNYTGEVEKDFVIALGAASDSDVCVEGNCYIPGNYSGTVTVRPKEEGWTIGKDKTGAFQEKLTYDSGLKDETVVYLKSTDGKIKQYILHAFEIDKTAPDIKNDDVTTAEDGASWTKEKNVKVNVPEDTYELYYSNTVTDLELMTSDTDKNGLTAIVVNGSIADFTVAKADTYYIFAVDKAGNVGKASITVSNIDTAPPFFEGIEDGEYYLSKERASIDFKVGDEENGSGMDCVICIDASLNEAVLTPNNGKYSISEAGDYIVKAVDCAGNESSVTVSVKKDTEAPSIGLGSAVNDAGYTAKTAENSYLFKNSLKVVLDITDEPGAGETAQAPVIVTRTKEDGSKTIIEPAQNQEYVDVLSHGGSYTYSVADAAGNVDEKASAVTIQTKKVEKKQIEGNISYQNLPVKILENDDTEEKEIDCFNENIKPEFFADFAGSENIVKIEYSVDGKNSYTSVYSNLDENNICTLGVDLNKEILQFDTGSSLTLRDGSYSYIFRVTDAVGTEKEYPFYFKVDKTAPEREVYVVYDSDIADKTNPDIFDSASDKKVFGKNQVEYYLLVKDKTPEGAERPYISGVSAENLTVVSKDSGIEVSKPELCENTYAVIDGVDYSAYTVFKGTLTIPNGQNPASAFDRLQITKLTDRAGNVTAAESTPVSGDTVIFIDNCPPKLHIDYGTSDSYVEKELDDVPYIHYKDTAVLTLTLDEDFYEHQIKDGKVVQPDVVLTKTVNGQTETVSVPEWKTMENEDYEAELALNLALEKKEEAVYHFTMTYQDGSGNKLDASSECKGNLEEGTFTSTAIVVDDKAPAITQVHIAEDSDDLDPGENSILTKNDVTVTAVVNDTFLDTVMLLKDGEDTGIAPNEGYPMEDGTYSWTISTDDYVKGNYQIAAFDMARNESYSDVLAIEIDKTAPKIEENGISINTEEWAAEHDGWVNEDTIFTVNVENDNGSSAAPGIRYRKTGEDIIHTAGAGREESDGRWIFTVPETDESFNGSYEFQVYDALENGKDDNGTWTAFAFQKDKILSDLDNIKAEYVDYEDETNKLPMGIFAKALDKIRETEFGEKLYERLFVKNKIQVTLYIHDEISGVREISYQYGGKTYAPVSASGKSENGCYDVFRFVLDGENADTLKIVRIEDKAGNVLDCNTKPELSVKGEGTSLLVIDGTAPTLSAVYPNCTGKEEDKKRRYYRQAEGQAYEEVLLTFTEQYLDKNVDMETGNVILPEVTVYKNGTGESGNIEDYLAEDASWNFNCWNRADGTMSAKLWLPYSSDAGGEEIEYTIRASYQDGSKNLLNLDFATDSFGEIEKDSDTYESGTLILDNKAPELIRYKIKGMTDRQADAVDVYHNVDDDDVNVTFTIDDNAEYWNEETVLVSVVDVTNGETLLSSHPELLGGSSMKEKITWEESGNLHTASFGFDGEDGKEAAYEVRISYEDRAGNKLITTTAEEGTLTEGVYTSAPFILDHVAPVFHISFSSAFRLTDSKNKDYKGKEKTPVANMTSYYGKAQGKVDIQVAINETYLAQDSNRANGIADFSFNINGSDTAMNWTKTGTVYTGTYSITEDGDYRISVSYQDAAGNKMVDADTVQGGASKDGVYTSPLLVLDTVAPVVTREYTASPVNVHKGRQYFGKNTTLKIQVQDENIRYKELKDVLLKMAAVDINGTKVKDTKAWIAVNGITEYGIRRGTWNVDIPLSTDANYTIPISYTDLAGNRAELNITELPTKDTTLPTDLELKYSANDPVNYKKFGYLFARHKMTITASAKDASAGIHIIRFTVTDEDGKKTVKEKTFNPGESKSYKVTIPLKSSDFKGTVKAEVLDWSGNQIERTRSHIVESAGKHSSSGKAVITTQTDPSRSVGDKDFYNTDVKLDLNIQDDYSGIGSYDYKLGSADTEKRSFREEAGEMLTDDKQTRKIVNEVSLKSLTLSADANNENDVLVTANYTDNAGHEGHAEQLYNIDTTVPVITVEYDLNDPSNERFYHQTRTATVTIQERNFDADDVEFTITNTDGTMPSISGWSSSGSGDDTKNVCDVTFSADGDYTFTVAFEDMAGNKAEYDRVDEFTIDQTKPELTVTYDNNQSRNEYYYAQSRTATIDILEHNFDPALIDIVTTADGAGAPSVSGWSRNGDHNVATVSFHADADYTFDITGMDQAENPLDEYETDRFVVDQTAPELEIFDIENMSANNGTVTPGIRYFDTNYDANGSVILMKGDHNGVQEMNGTKTVTANGMEIKLDDFAHVPEMDDLYTMEATVYDLAGNSSEASVLFSVNRFGSVYTFDDRTELLVGLSGQYYTKEEQDIVITETNVDTLEFKEITCNLNGNLRTMVEGEDYTVKASGTDVSWKQYTYTINKSNFEEEGTYILTVYSEDRATNISDNHTKNKKIEFVVDKTKPSVVISGVENKGRYTESSREITLDVQDNVRMAEVEVTLDGTTTTYSSSQVEEMDGKITLTAESANRWQTLSVKAYDAARNPSDQTVVSFLITPNILVQFFMNKILFYGTFALFVMLGAGIWWFLILRRKKKEEE